MSSGRASDRDVINDSIRVAGTHPAGSGVGGGEIVCLAHCRIPGRVRHFAEACFEEAGVRCAELPSKVVFGASHDELRSLRAAYSRELDILSPGGPGAGGSLPSSCDVQAAVLLREALRTDRPCTFIVESRFRNDAFATLDILCRAGVAVPVLALIERDGAILEGAWSFGPLRKDLKCVECGADVPFDPLQIICRESHPHTPYYGDLESGVSKAGATLAGVGHPWANFRQLLCNDTSDVTLTERQTPLVDLPSLGRALGLESLSVKDEGANPTGSFKDRAIWSVVNVAKEAGIEDLYIFSCGNAAISAAHYSQAADMDLVCVVPGGITDDKRFLLENLGASVEVSGEIYEAGYRRGIERDTLGRYDITPGRNPFADDGVKTLGYELMAQRAGEGRPPPDLVVAPAGNGTLVWGLMSSFLDLKSNGRLDDLPEVMAVQVADAAPLARSLRSGQVGPADAPAPASMLDAILAEESFSAVKFVEKSKEYRAAGGKVSVVEVTDSETLAACDLVDAYAPGVSGEISSFSPVAALAKTRRGSRSDAVWILTGSNDGRRT